MSKEDKTVPYQVWESCLKMIDPPSSEQTVWKIPDANRLGLVIIEFRSHPWFFYVLNMVLVNHLASILLNRFPLE